MIARWIDALPTLLRPRESPRLHAYVLLMQGPLTFYFNTSGCSCFQEKINHCWQLVILHFIHLFISTLFVNLSDSWRHPEIGLLIKIVDVHVFQIFLTLEAKASFFLQLEGCIWRSMFWFFTLTNKELNM